MHSYLLEGSFRETTRFSWIYLWNMDTTSDWFVSEPASHDHSVELSEVYTVFVVVCVHLS